MTWFICEDKWNDCMPVFKPQMLTGFVRVLADLQAILLSMTARGEAHL